MYNMASQLHEVTSTFLSNNDFPMLRISYFVERELAAAAPYLSRLESVYDLSSQICEIVRNTGLLTLDLFKLQLRRLRALHLLDTAALDAFARELRMFAMHVGSEASFHESHWLITDTYEPLYQHNQPSQISCVRLLNRLTMFISSTIITPHRIHTDQSVPEPNEFCCLAYDTFCSLLNSTRNSNRVSHVHAESLVSNMLKICQIVKAYSRTFSSIEKTNLLGQIRRMQLMYTVCSNHDS
ncbi:hypothetical protein Ciccas_001197 [Cichlidogyrus casuarinus]|uniref:Uncharacterized protein n=1 Tax=Cichlidogyrus casuarinus TaxID=1844966 RepID=A0ABD2QKS5_9PLAT